MTLKGNCVECSQHLSITIQRVTHTSGGGPHL